MRFAQAWEILYALTKGLLDLLTSDESENFKREFPKLVQSAYPDLYDKLRSTKEFPDDLKAQVDECLKKYFKK